MHWNIEVINYAKVHVTPRHFKLIYKKNYDFHTVPNCKKMLKNSQFFLFMVFYENLRFCSKFKWRVLDWLLNKLRERFEDFGVSDSFPFFNAIKRKSDQKQFLKCSPYKKLLQLCKNIGALYENINKSFSSIEYLTEKNSSNELN